MAFRQSAAPAPRNLCGPQSQQEESTSSFTQLNLAIEESQEWILFSPSQDASTTTGSRTGRIARPVDLSRISEFGTLTTRSGQAAQSSLDEALTEDRELDSLDEGLQAFREPSLYRSASNLTHGAVLPTHDGLGTFPASSALAQEQLWQHERYASKRKYEGSQHSRSSIERRLDTVEELDLQISEDKRLRIEQWRMDQSKALLDEVENETRTRKPHQSSSIIAPTASVANEIGGVPKQSDQSRSSVQVTEETEPFWRRVTRTFIRDIIGIDEPLLSVIVGETLPEDIQAITHLGRDRQDGQSELQFSSLEDVWPDRLLHRIARELGLLVNRLSPHPGAFSTPGASVTPDYAGIPMPERPSALLNSWRTSNGISLFKPTTVLAPILQKPAHDVLWEVEDETPQELRGDSSEIDEAERLRRERECWERELDIKMVFRFLKSRVSQHASSSRAPTSHPPAAARDDSMRRADVIRRHHPLVARAHKPSLARLRRDSSLRTFRRSASSCASASVKSGRKPLLARSGGSSHNYWDIGGSMGSGSAIASGGMMGAWGEV